MKYRYYERDGIKFRTGVRDGWYVLDQVLTELGWEGEKDTGDGTGDWVNLKKDKV